MTAPQPLDHAGREALLVALQQKYGGTIDHPDLKDATVAGAQCIIKITSGMGVRVVAKGQRYNWRELTRFVRMDLGLPDLRIELANDDGPVDVWARTAHPPLPLELLPETIAEFASVNGEIMGADPAGLAMSALATCAAAIPDSIVIRPKQHDAHWQESARLWVALVGLPSTKKSPIISAATRPLKSIDADLHREYREDKAAYDALPADQRKATTPPPHVRLRLEDTTIEAAQDVLADSPNGVLLIQDELSGWFGSMDKYSGGSKGSAKDRAFWLQAFNGGSYVVNRVGRGSMFIPNLSVSLLGGVQPEPIRAIARGLHDDGLLQRLFPIVLRPAAVGQDVPVPDVSTQYAGLVSRLSRLRKPIRGISEIPLRFTPEAQAVWREVTDRSHALAESWETVNVKLAAHIGKYDGLFARLCLVWHCIECHGNSPVHDVTEHTAARVRDFLFGFLHSHAVAFYTDVIGLSDRQDQLQAVAGWILTHRPEKVSVRDVRRGDRIMRDLTNQQAEEILVQLDALGWLEPLPSPRRDSKEFAVLPSVHTLFDERAADETLRRMDTRALIKSSLQLQAA